MQTQTSNTLHNAIMEAGGKDRPPMLASGNYVQWKSRIKRYIDTKPNHELIHYCLRNLPYEYKWNDKDGESLESYYSWFYKMMNELVRNQCDFTNHLVNVQFLLQLQPEWQRANQDNSPRINRGTGENVGTPVVQKSKIQCYNCKEYRHVVRECQKPKRAKDAAYHNEKMLLCKQEEVKFQLNAEQADWRDDTDDEPDDQELEAHYMYMAQIQEIDQNDDDDLANERDLLASLIEKLKCEIDDSKNRNKFLETSNKALVDKLKGEIENFKTKNKSLESSNNHFKQANNELSKTNQLMFKDLKKFQAELDRYNDVKYASKVEIYCAKAKGDLMSYKMESKKSFHEYTRKINDLNQTISEMKKELFAHQETISIMTQPKEA
nr:hypothetical protein [Tanacetum cinerariifolium]